MSERQFGSRRLLLSFLIFFVALLSAGCTTTFLEYSGRMANQGSNNHVEPYQGASTDENNNEEAVRPAMRIPAAGRLPVYLQELVNSTRAKK